MIHINIGYECGDGLHCDKYSQCKHRAKWYKFHNISVSLHRFFEYRLNIKIPYLLYIGQEWKRLSGTEKCPFHKSRYYSCYDCKYMGDPLDANCICNVRNNTPYKERLEIQTEWGNQCGYFEKCEWADDYK